MPNVALGEALRTTRSDREIAALADPKLGQHVLVSPGKLSRLVAAAGIRTTDAPWKSEPESAPSPGRSLLPGALRS